MSIFVSIASYRDDECTKTLVDLFKKADNPSLVFVGICQQNNNDDIDCVPANFKYKCNIRVIKIPSHQAKGPTFARYLCSTLYDDELYFMQIDSHIRFVNGWDTRCINMITNLETSGIPKPILSYYSKQFEEEDNNLVPRICKSFFNERGMISFLGAESIDNSNVKLPTPNAYVAAGFFFVKGSFLKEIPFDPELDYVFVGEEILHSIRFYTHGYDIYSPNQDIVFHEYTRLDKPKIWTDSQYSDANAVDKIMYMIGLSKKPIQKYLLKNLDKYGIGSERTVDDYYKYAGISPESKIVSRNFCRGTNDDADVESYKKNNWGWYRMLLVLAITLSIIALIIRAQIKSL